MSIKKGIGSFFLLFFGLASAVLASSRPRELWLKDLPAQDLLSLFETYDYNGALPLPDYRLPPIFLSRLPQDLQQLPEETRKRLFIQILAPLALKVNEEIARERRELLALQTEFQSRKDLSAPQMEALEAMARKYDVFTRLQGYRRIERLLNALSDKVDAVPPSFLIAAAAIATDWGQSRPAREANSLYKELVWHTDQGLLPEGEPADSDYRIRIFPDLYGAMTSYALKINSSITYEQFRHLRRNIRYREKPLLGTETAHLMLLDTPLKNYAGLLQYTIAFYELNIIDKSKLNSKMIDKDLAPNFAKFIQKDKNL